MRLQKRHRPLATALLLTASAALGCSSSEGGPTIPRVAVTGDVSLGGQPLPEGKIEFVPTTSGTAEIAVGSIENGHYSIVREVGPSPGKYKVRISSRKSVKIAEGQEPGGGPDRKEAEKVPKKYNAASTLETEVPAGSSAKIDFPLDAK